MKADPLGGGTAQDINTRPLCGGDGPLACDSDEVRREFCGVCVKTSLVINNTEKNKTKQAGAGGLGKP